MTKDSHVLIIGDASLDWHIIKPRDFEEKAVRWNKAGGDLVSQPGGVELLRYLVAGCLECRISPKVSDNTGDMDLRESTTPSTSVTQIMTLCGLYPQEIRSKNSVIRIESLCGFRPNETLRPLEISWQSGDAPSIVVVDDAGLGIRTQAPELASILASLAKDHKGEAPWVILKVAWPVLDSPLLAELVRDWGQKLIVITPIDDLRQDNVQLSRGLSWERTAQDLSWEFNYNPRMKILAGIYTLVVPIGLSGVWVSSPRNTEERPDSLLTSSTLIFDPSCIEGDWEKERPGLLLGYTSCLALGFLSGLFTEKVPDLIDASRRGLSAMRALHTNGYRVDPQLCTIELPVDQICQALEKPLEFPSVAVPLGYRHFSVPAGGRTESMHAFEWSILKAGVGSSEKLYELGIQIVKQGVKKSLGQIPFASFGAFVTVDRDEIEGFRTIYDLIQDYCNNPSLYKPLSIAVFGPPGSGKSFGVEQVAKAIAGGTIEKITLNVSQFTSNDDLVDALHRVRDIGLSGKIPLVFWDEFDANTDAGLLSWLKAFLAPMQDGMFSQGEISHPIGRAIFVFAGGTSSSIEELGASLDEKDWRAAKVPDFKSRLRGCIDIVGINRVVRHRVGTGIAADSDLQYVIRRAIILRSIIERTRPDIISKDGTANIDYGLLKALLSVWEFKHGVRSLESIIELCHLGDAGGLHRSSLPPQGVLALHVDTDEFLGLITAGVEFSGEELEKVAAANHEIYRRNAPQSRLASLAYDKLSEEDKNKNRNAVKGIPYKLAAIKYAYGLQSSTDTVSRDNLFDADAEQLGRLEHDRWIVATIDNGYVYGKERDDTGFPRRHPDLVPWDELDERELLLRYPEIIASKLGKGPLTNPVDMGMAKDIPKIMRLAGFKVRKL